MNSPEELPETFPDEHYAGPSVTDEAEKLKRIFDALIGVGFNREEAMRIICSQVNHFFK